jgi:hypothetical protein
MGSGAPFRKFARQKNPPLSFLLAFQDKIAKLEPMFK